MYPCELAIDKNDHEKIGISITFFIVIRISGFGTAAILAVIVIVVGSVCIVFFPFPFIFILFIIAIFAPLVIACIVGIVPFNLVGLPI